MKSRNKKKVAKKSRKIKLKVGQEFDIDDVANSIKCSGYLVKDRITHVLLALRYIAKNKWFSIKGIGKVRFRVNGMEVRFEDGLKKLLKGDYIPYEEIKKILWD
jgi:hypothetical protein